MFRNSDPFSPNPDDTFKFNSVDPKDQFAFKNLGSILDEGQHSHDSKLQALEAATSTVAGSGTLGAVGTQRHRHAAFAGGAADIVTVNPNKNKNKNEHN